MEDPNITMKVYIQLEAEKAHRRCQTFNWENATYDKVRYFDDIDYFKYFETEFPPIVYKDALTSKPEVSLELTIWHHYLLELRDTYGLGMRIKSTLMLIFIILRIDWLGGVRRRMSWRQFILALGLHTAKEMDSDGFVAHWAENAREITTKGDLSAYWTRISSNGGFLNKVPSYTLIRDLLKRLCQRLIAFSIAKRSQAPKKVTTTDLFYLRSMDNGAVRLLDIPTWIAPGPERQQVGVAAEDAQVDPERIQRLEDEVCRLRASFKEQRLVVDAMSKDFSRFTSTRQPVNPVDDLRSPHWMGYIGDSHDLEDSLIMGNEDLNTIPEKESDKFIKSSVEDLVPILSESEDTPESESVCILPSCDDFSPIDVPEEKTVTFSNPLFNSNDDFIFSDDESLSNEDVPKDNVKI
nr:hypothetical protein [Tanacetum cinerariifolium]